MNKRGEEREKMIQLSEEISEENTNLENFRKIQQEIIQIVR